MPYSLRLSSPPAAIALVWVYAVSAFQQFRILCASCTPIGFLAMLLAIAVARARLDLILVLGFFLTCAILFRPQQLPCAASAFNTTTGPVPESPSDVESSSHSSTNPEGGLKSVAGVVAGNLAAPRMQHQPNLASKSYDHSADPDNLQIKDNGYYYTLLEEKASSHKVTAYRPRTKFASAPVSTPFTPHKVVPVVSSPRKTKRRPAYSNMVESHQEHEKPSWEISNDTHESQSLSEPSTSEPSVHTRQHIQDTHYLRHMSDLAAVSSANMRSRVQQSIHEDTLRYVQRRLALMWSERCSSSASSRHCASAPAGTTWCPAVETPMDIDVVDAADACEPMEQDAPAQNTFVFGQTSTRFPAHSSPSVAQFPPFPTQAPVSNPQFQPSRFAFGQTSAFAPAFGRTSPYTTSTIQPTSSVNASQSGSPRAPAQPLSPFLSAFTQPTARELEQQQREEQLRAQREAQREQSRLAMEREVQRRAFIEASRLAEIDRRRQEETERRYAAQEQAAEEQRKKEDSARARAKASARVHSSLSRSTSAPSTPKPAKKVAFADENPLPLKSASSVTTQNFSNTPTSQPIASSSSDSAPFDAKAAANDFLANMAKDFGGVEFEDPAAQFPDVDEGEETEVDDHAQALAVKQAQGEHDEPEGFDEMIDRIEAAKAKGAQRKKAADYLH